MYIFPIRVAWCATRSAWRDHRGRASGLSSEIVEYLTADIHRKVDLNNPDKLIWVDAVGWETAISLLGPDDIFTLGLSQL
jgi:tRNA(Ser,Leu) C12 N-acetylase TAN1